MASTQPPSNQPNRSIIFGLGTFGVAGLVACVCLAALIVGGIVFWWTRSTSAAEPTVAYVLDASLRMELPAEGSDGQSRLSVAQAVLAEVIRPAEPSLTSGLRVFGSGANAEACQDTDLVVSYGPSNQSKIVSELSALTIGPSIDAALAEAMIAAIRELAQHTGPHWLVVVTGGADSCNPDAGQLIAQEAKRAGIDLQTFVIGYQLSESESEAVKAMLASAGSADYHPAPDEDTLRSILVAVQNYINAPSDALRAAIAAAAAPDPLATAAPIAGPTDTALVHPTQVPHTAQTACDHAYFPLRPGAWQYEAEGSRVWSVASVTGDLASAAAGLDLADYRQWMPDQIVYECSAAGIVLKQVSRRVYRAGEGEAYYYSTLSDYALKDQNGVVLPAESDFAVGAAWTHTYTLLETDTGQDDSTYSRECRVTGAETLAIGEAVYDTLKVECGETETVFERAASSGPWGAITWLGRSATIQRTAWYAYGVGLVRFEVTSQCAYSNGNDCSVNYTGEIEGYAFVDNPPEGYSFQTACGANLYFPLTDGASWQYSNGRSEEIMFANGDLLEATAPVQAYAGGDQEMFTYQCGPEGIAYESVEKYVEAQDAAGNSLGRIWLSAYILEQDGVFLPPVGQLAPGASWRHSYTFSPNFADPGETYAGECRAVGVESLSVGAGTFDALKVECAGEAEVFEYDDQFSGAHIRASRSSITRTMWLVYGVGVAKLEYSSQCAYSDGGDCSESYSYDLISNGFFGGGGGGGGGNGPGPDDPDEAYSGGLGMP